MDRSTNRALETFAPPALTFILFVAAWEIALRVVDVPPFLVPPPHAILASLAANIEPLSGALLTTAEGAILGFLLSVVVGTLTGLFLSLSRTVERALYPYALFLQTVPIVAVAPLLVLWFGPGLRAVSVSAFIVSVFPVITNTLSGLRATEPRLYDLFHLYRASRKATLFKLELPFALPSLVAGYRVASGLSVIGAIVGEFVAGFSEGRAGLGIIVLSAYRQLQTDLLFAAVGLSSLLGLVLFAMVNAVSGVLLRRFRSPG